MKKILIVFVPILILIILAVSNPSKAEYVEWANKQFIGTNDNLLSKIGSAIASPIISEATTFDNYLIFTVYKTVNIDGSVYKTLGICRNFVFISKTEGYIKLNNDYSGTNQTSANNTGADINGLIESAGAKVSSFIDSANKALNKGLTSGQTQAATSNTDDLDIGGTIVEGKIYNNYTNGRYGFSIDYPNQFYIGIPPVNDDGLEFVS